MSKKKLKYMMYIIFLLLIIYFLKNPYKLSDNILKAPSFNNFLGTDDLGRDIYSRLVMGTFNSIFIVIISIGLASIIGNIIGLLSGYYGGFIDYIVSQFIEMILSIPGILIAVAVVVIVRKAFLSLVLALIIMYLPLIIMYTRGLVIKEKSKEYITANKTYGVSNYRIITKHIYRNIRKYIFVNFGINFSKGILTEAGLGFLGIGLDPSTPTLGNMLNASQSYFISSPWFTIFPGLVIIFIVYNVRKLSNIKEVRNNKMKSK
ncbi:ABC transporter permease [Oceanivirga miroungae]|uniref:Binding-protein-dependent transport system inner membrane protein n=1 Tax=Oceanivirga miroungae TaxID=1130046 RepID=A0A6I8M8X5_9FUSO|nr:ABC transporter permease [Oceanivirga miroungae]VWL85265.1 binding-protein-dependent transport system inner membrane protein [Oceanivirga miroungae]